MKVDFRNLSLENKAKAIANVIKISGTNHLAYLLEVENNNITGWFSFERSAEGFDYWSKLDEDDYKPTVKEYEVEITETLVRVVTVEATSPEQAIEFVKYDYNNDEITLDSDDFFDVDFNNVNQD